MGSLDLGVTLLGIVYGIILIAATFISNRFTEVLRLDVMFLPNPSASTRVINLVAGLLIAGYNIYSLIA